MKAPVGYSGTPLWRKLGYRDRLTALVVGAPDGYLENLCLPEDVGVTWLTAPKNGLQFVHLFATARSKLESEIQKYRKKMLPDGVVWVSWPKKSSGVASDITDNVIREVALPLGLVDIKVCAVDEIWSGLKLMVRKDQR